uniref:Uncharacterized protein n=1 Tax=viral metagenome TaxID=1070528 RepID=A0A6C0H9K3_9ZZZZ
MKYYIHIKHHKIHIIFFISNYNKKIINFINKK